MSRLLGGTVLSAVAVVVLAPSLASAHVGTDKSEITADASTTLTFSIGHGCEDSATNSMKFQIPESIVNAAPQVKPGWTITTERADLAEPAEAGHGEEQTDRVAVVTFTADAGFEVNPEFRDSFTLAFNAPAEGELFFKVVQGCEEGENAWIEEWDGTGDEPEHPAPSVMVVAAAEGEAGDHHAEETATTVEGDHDDEAAAATTVSVADESGDDDGGDSNGVAIAALAVGGLGLAAGGTALARSGRKPSAE